MKSVQDSLYNWLTIKVVSDARPDDSAAQNTTKMFEDIIHTEHEISDLEVTTDEVMYYISYVHKGERKKSRFPREMVEFMLDQMNQEPEKYVNYPPVDTEDWVN